MLLALDPSGGLSAEMMTSTQNETTTKRQYSHAKRALDFGYVSLSFVFGKPGKNHGATKKSGTFAPENAAGVTVLKILARVAEIFCSIQSTIAAILGTKYPAAPFADSCGWRKSG